MKSKHCTLDELLNNYLHSFTYDEKCKVKNKRPTPYLLIEYKDGKFTRTFQSSWYDKYTWLSGRAFFKVIVTMAKRPPSVLLWPLSLQRLAMRTFLIFSIGIGEKIFIILRV
jgi:hypothetical protein|uniref:Uncharacterized protein n=1 Tax=Sipha flava TaxID=143950 RepID=A0A2S2Q9I9_9HEMI